MLDDQEWDSVAPLLSSHIKEVQRLRKEGFTADEARDRASKHACKRFNQITGFQETNPQAIWHHRRSLYGRDCPRCGKPFRTVQAKFCAECGFIPNETG